MDVKTQETIKAATESVIRKIEGVGDYNDLKLFLMQTEVQLGGLERKEFQNEEPDLDYINALDSAWAIVCEAAIDKAESLAEGDESLAESLNASPEEMGDALSDNYLHGAFAAAIAARDNEDIKKLPLLANAAFNKHSYDGYQDEIACLRLLLWAGFDPNAQRENGATALHYMASMKSNLASHPRAVRLLLNAGIDPNLKNSNGDTALCYMGGSTSWHEVHTQSAWILLDGGADPFIEANDGECAYSLWRKNRDANEDVADLVDAIERVMEKRSDDDGDAAYYKMVGDQIKQALANNDEEGFNTICGYLMAIIVAKRLGRDNEFATRITPMMLDDFDTDAIVEHLTPSIETMDSVAIGKAAHAYLNKQAKARFEALKASMEQ